MLLNGVIITIPVIKNIPVKYLIIAINKVEYYIFQFNEKKKINKIILKNQHLYRNYNIRSK